MFSGIGGFREGLTRAGGFVCVGHCEIDKYANRSYNALFDTKGEWFVEDARKADPETMPEFRLLCGGFPCQTFSIAGSRKGFGDSRGTLFFELARLAEARKPSYLLFENVPYALLHIRYITIMTLAAANTLGMQVSVPAAILLSIMSALGACGASGVAGGSLLLIPMACSLFGISNDIAMQVVGVGFIIGVIQDSVETALNSAGDVEFAATAEYHQWLKEDKPLPAFMGGK